MDVFENQEWLITSQKASLPANIPVPTLIATYQTSRLTGSYINMIFFSHELCYRAVTIKVSPAFWLEAGEQEAKSLSLGPFFFLQLSNGVETFNLKLKVW